MLKKILLLLVSLPLCVGASCNVSCNGVPFLPTVDVELDLADCVMRIVQSAGATEATVGAAIADNNGAPVELNGGQAISVNGQALSATGFDGLYSATVTADSTYTITVTEPTRGVETTTITAPADFAITSPADGGSASLSGFTLTWSNPDPNLQATINLSQTLFEDVTEETFGPYTDTGSVTLDAESLADFYQGANIVITVTKSKEQSLINGFNSGDLTVERSVTSLASPAP